MSARKHKLAKNDGIEGPSSLSSQSKKSKMELSLDQKVSTYSIVS